MVLLSASIFFFDWSPGHLAPIPGSVPTIGRTSCSRLFNKKLMTSKNGKLLLYASTMCSPQGFLSPWRSLLRNWSLLSYMWGIEQLCNAATLKSTAVGMTRVPHLMRESSTRTASGPPCNSKTKCNIIGTVVKIPQMILRSIVFARLFKANYTSGT